MTTKNIVISIFAVIVIAGGIYYFTSSRQVSVPETVSNNDSPQNEFVFTGEGRKIIGPVTLNEGLVILKAKNQSGINSVFSVNVYEDTNGNGVFENEEEYSGWIGTNISVGYETAEAFDGAIDFKSNGGGYSIAMEGGRWQVTLVPMEKLSEPAPAPTSFSGKSIQVTEKFYLPAGEYTFSTNNKGGGNFIIRMVDEDGNSTGRLVNEIDDYEGDFTVKNVFDGNYVFAITGGDWTIEKK